MLVNINITQSYSLVIFLCLASNNGLRRLNCGKKLNGRMKSMPISIV